MNFNDLRANENKGFSLVELIVVMAIMAVMTAVLAPALLGYVERSRAQKDDSAMGEVTNAINLAMSDQDIYDEVLFYSAKNNYSCYSDGVTAPTNNDKIVMKAADTTKGTKENWMYSDNTRVADETEYLFDGYMRGVTISFYPSNGSEGNKTVFNLKDARINDGLLGKKTADGSNSETASTQKSVGGGTRTGDFVSGITLTEGTNNTLGTMTTNNGHNYLYNRVRSVIGDTIELTSQTYRNSDYTVFIKVGSVGGNDAASQDAIKVYGQWSGTNLTANDAALGGTVQE